MNMRERKRNEERQQQIADRIMTYLQSPHAQYLGRSYRIDPNEAAGEIFLKVTQHSSPIRNIDAYIKVNVPFHYRNFLNSSKRRRLVQAIRKET